MILIIYFLGFVITFILVAYLNVKSKWEFDVEAAACISILWPVVIFFCFPIYLFIVSMEWSWKMLNKLFEKIINSAVKDGD